jgi:Ankyrin repeats (3 copies)
MNQVPPGENEPDDVDDLYRRASAGDDSRPSEWVRSSVFAHAAHLAADRSRQKEPAGIASRRRENPTWRRPAIFGTLAAAALAGLLIAPHFLPPPAPRVTAASQAPATPAPQAPALQEVPPQVAREQTRDQTAPSQDALSEAVPSAPSRAARSRTPAEAEKHSSGMLADQRPPPAAPAEEQKLAKAAGASARNDAPAQVAGRVNAQHAAAAPMAAGTAAPADATAELRRAAETGDAPKLQHLLDRQPDIDARDESGRTALLLAAQHGQAHAVDVLLARGADPNAADANGNTPLKAAIEGHQPAIAAALQRAGAR